MASALKPVASYDDFAALTSLKRDGKTGSATSIREVARQFESLFTRMVLKSVREADLGDPLFGDDAMKQYQEMYDDQLAIQLSSGKGLGLADLLVRQLSQSGAAVESEVDAGGATAAQSAAGLGVVPPGGGVARGRRAAPYASQEQRERAAVAAVAASPAPADLPGVPTADPPSGLAGYGSGDFAADLGAEFPLEPAAAAVSGAAAAVPAPASLEDTQAAFVQALWPSAVEAGAELGVDPRTLIAHAALETGWGRSLEGAAGTPCTHNLFGIKATVGWSGASSLERTVEFEDGIPRLRTARFRAYRSNADCFHDYVALLRGDPRYARALGTGADVEAFGTALAHGGYATDPRYATKLAAVANALKKIPVPSLTASRD
jgi:flagellar protein FlgJ